MSAVYNSTVQGFYLSYYGRPADPAGLTFWTGQLAAAGGNLDAILMPSAPVLRRRVGMVRARMHRKLRQFISRLLVVQPIRLAWLSTKPNLQPAV